MSSSTPTQTGPAKRKRTLGLNDLDDFQIPSYSRKRTDDDKDSRSTGRRNEGTRSSVSSNASTTSITSSVASEERAPDRNSATSSTASKEKDDDNTEESGNKGEGEDGAPSHKKKKTGESILRVKTPTTDRADVPKASGFRVQFKKDLIHVKEFYKRDRIHKPAPGEADSDPSDDEGRTDDERRAYEAAFNEDIPNQPSMFDQIGQPTTSNANNYNSSFAPDVGLKKFDRSEATAAFKSIDNRIIPSTPWYVPSPILFNAPLPLVFGSDASTLQKWSSTERTRPPIRPDSDPKTSSESPAESNNLRLKLQQIADGRLTFRSPPFCYFG